VATAWTPFGVVAGPGTSSRSTGARERRLERNLARLVEELEVANLVEELEVAKP
jgi:hypothetical protein